MYAFLHSDSMQVVVVVLGTLLGAAPLPLGAQQHERPAPPPVLALSASARPLEIFLGTDAVAFTRVGVWFPGGDRLGQSTARHTVRNAIVGGVIGGAVGILACTLISNTIDDEAAGTSTCTWKGNVAFGVSGFAVGALVGWLVS